MKVNHYDIAEDLNARGVDLDTGVQPRDRLIASAQVHATLALADAVRNLSEIIVERS